MVTVIMSAVMSTAGFAGCGAPTSTTPSRTGATAAVPFEFGAPVNLGPGINSIGFDGGPSVSADGLTLFYISERDGGSGGGDIWVATRRTPSEPFGRVTNLGSTVNGPGDEGSPSISHDGLSLYFDSDPSRSGGIGSGDIWLTTRKTLSDPFGISINLGAPVDSAAADGFPNISADGLSLYFVSDRPGGYGGTDLWVATRETTAQPFSIVTNLGPAVNTSAMEWSPDISPNGLTLFLASDRSGTTGVMDLWVTVRTTTASPFGRPVNLGRTVNSPVDDAGPALTPDGSTLYFMSRRDGGLGFFDLWDVPIKRRA
jgi:Tol biopolymer transport system component